MSFGGMTPEAAEQLNKSLARDADTDAQIDAAHELASNYDGDDRPCIKTDVMNAFYRGVVWGREHPLEVTPNVPTA